MARSVVSSPSAPARRAGWRAPVDLALGCAGHQRRALGEALVLRRPRRPALGHRRHDLGAPGREHLDHFARDTGDLEAPVGVRLLDAVAELRETLRELAPVERAQQHLRFVEPQVRLRPCSTRTMSRAT